MRVFVEGLPIPNTGEWWAEDHWTVGDLKADVVKIITSKLSNPDAFTLSYDGVDLVDTDLLNSVVADDSIVTIRIIGL